MKGLKIQAEEIHPGIACLTMEGYLDAHTYQDLEAALEEHFRENRYRYVLNLTELEYISSVGAGVLINAACLCQDHDGGILLVRPSPGVKEVLDLLGVSQFFEEVPDREQALRRFLADSRA